ncbi:ISSth1, transposase (orf2), IS3 family [Streptococcus sp. HSISS3]|nr:ISSth1, transposase (orf2), IS3 family [Streptococcus sp. HSISS3]
MLKAQGMTQSMSRVSRCIDNGPMESWQGIIKEMRAVLYPKCVKF